MQQEIARQRWAILCGILLGLTALTRPNGILLLGLLAVWALLTVLTKVLPWQAVLKHLFVIACITAAIIAPWTFCTNRIFCYMATKKTQLLVVHLFLILTILQNVIFYSDMRFRAPIEPFLVILAGGAFWWLASKIYSHRNLLL